MPKKSIADIRREEFATAAFAVLSEHGMHGTTLQRVAERTGASKASVLHYFGSKQILIETALRKANATLRREAVALMGLAETPWERFYAIIEANFSQTTFNRKGGAWLDFHVRGSAPQQDISAGADGHLPAAEQQPAFGAEAHRSGPRTLRSIGAARQSPD